MPRWGGLAFFIGILPVFLFLEMNRQITAYLIASSIIITIGGIDDRNHLGWRIKFLGILLATTVVVFGGGVVIQHIGTYGSYGRVMLGIFSIPFTYFGVVGVTNAINLIDGLNGLAGGVSLIAFLFFAIAGYLSGNYVVAAMSIAFVGALMGFLRYNFPKARIFMGDSGSLFLGFSLAVFSIFLTHDERFRIEPMFPVMVLLVPIFDALRVMLVRAFNLKNPFKADKTHLHHLLIRKGVSSIKTVIFIWSLSIVFGLIAILAIKRTSTPYLVLSLLGSLILSFYADSLGRRKR
jgi:UDP-GlcNAc:undecaprenyl-phosphate GlcNAc-1-phosphate transferase